MDFVCDPDSCKAGVDLKTQDPRPEPRNSFFAKLQAGVAIACLLAGTSPSYAMGQQTQTPPAPAPSTDKAVQGLPPEPTPNYTQPLYMRPTPRDFSQPRGYFPNPLAPYTATSVPLANFSNSPKLDDLVKNGKIYLSLSDAIVLALENNYDIAIQRYNLNIADTDLLRARAGSTLLGVPSGLVTGTLGGTTAALSAGGGPGGTTGGAGGAAAGTSGLSLSTNGGGPLPEQLDPTINGTIQLERTLSPQTTKFLTGTNTLSQTTDEYNFGYNQGFLTGTALSVTFNNQRVASNSINSSYSPALQSNFRAQITQHLLQGFGTGVNGRFIIQAKNDRRITDSAFRQQLLYTINQIENIYWGMVSAYEGVQSAQRAIAQSTQLAADDRKQLQIGTMAPLDVVNADAAVATDRETLTSAQSTLEYQELLMKQAISRNIDDPVLSNAPVIPTDRVSLLEMPEEHMSVDDLVKEADANSPAIEQAMLTLKNDEITLKGVKNGLLPTLDVYAFYGASAVGGAVNPRCGQAFFPGACNVPTVGYPSTFQNLFNSSGPDKGVGFNINIPLRNRTAQAEQMRSVIEFRQAQMRLAQLYVQTRMKVINGQFALTNDRAQVQSSLAGREYARQSLDAEQKKLKLGASTTANVLQMERNLATAENNVITATAKYATDRAALEETLSSTLDKYGISIGDAVTGNITQMPVIPGLQPAQKQPEAVVPQQKQNLQKQEQQPAQPQANPMPQQPAPQPQSHPLPQQPAQPQG